MSDQQPQYQMPQQPPPPSTHTPKKGRSNAMALVLAIGAGFFLFVVIIGILAAIAVPNFQRFNSRAKQSEAKVALASAYTGEKMFQTEWNVGTTDMVSLGYQPEGNYKYHVGFALPAVAQWDTIGIPAETHDPSRSDTTKLPGNALELGTPFEQLAQKYCPDCVVDGENFKIVAIGNIDQDETLDVWTIDQDKKLVNVVDDTKD